MVMCLQFVRLRHSGKRGSLGPSDTCEMAMKVLAPAKFGLFVQTFKKPDLSYQNE